VISFISSITSSTDETGITAGLKSPILIIIINTTNKKFMAGVLTDFYYTHGTDGGLTRPNGRVIFIIWI
jgi:hypothetical protein